MNSTLETIAEQDLKQAIAYADSLQPLFDAICNFPGSGGLGSPIGKERPRHQSQRAVEAEGPKCSAGSKPASPTIQQHPVTAEEHNKFPRGRW